MLCYNVKQIKGKLFAFADAPRTCGDRNISTVGATGVSSLMHLVPVCITMRKQSDKRPTLPLRSILKSETNDLTILKTPQGRKMRFPMEGERFSFAKNFEKTR